MNRGRISAVFNYRVTARATVHLISGHNPAISQLVAPSKSPVDHLSISPPLYHENSVECRQLEMPGAVLPPPEPSPIARTAVRATVHLLLDRICQDPAVLLPRATPPPSSAAAQYRPLEHQPEMPKPLCCHPIKPATSAITAVATFSLFTTVVGCIASSPVCYTSSQIGSRNNPSTCSRSSPVLAQPSQLFAIARLRPSHWASSSSPAITEINTMATAQPPA